MGPLPHRRAGLLVTADRLAMVVRSDDFDDLVLALSTAGIVAGAGKPVRLFFTGRAARLLRRGALADLADTPLDPVGEQLRDGCASLGMADLEALLHRAKGLGDVRLYVCARAARIFDLTPDTLYEEVDSVLGAASFLLNDALGATVMTI